MKYRPLGRTGLDVSVICLGTMTWGEQNTPEEAFAQLDRAVDLGVNFIDTAEMYPIPPRAETYGRTEEIIGAWFDRSGARDKVVLASKVLGRADRFPYVRDGKLSLSRRHVIEACDASLKRLRTDRIDLYQLHWPDRATNFFGAIGYTHDPDDSSVPLQETLGALKELVDAGKVLHVGLSNETPWGVHACLRLAEAHGLPRMQAIQNPYGLLNRTFEVGLAEMAIREDCGLLAYSPLGFGVLSGKYLEGDRPAGARLSLWGDYFHRYTKPRGIAATRAYVDLARAHGLDPSQMALAYCNTRPFLTSTIIGSRTMEQLETDIGSIDVALPAELLDAIEVIHRDNPNPAP